MTDNDTDYRRRQVLAGLSGLVALGPLAGCSQLTGGNGNGDSGNGGNGGSGGNGGGGNGNGGSGGNGGGGNGNGGSGGNGGGGNGNGGSGGNGGGGNGGGGNTTAANVWQPFQFDETATFVYDVTQQGQSGELTWEIQSVSANGATVRAALDLGQMQQEVTVSGTPDQIRQQMMQSPAGAILAATFFSPAVVQASGQEFTVGSGWTFQTSDGTAQMEVTGKETRAGVECSAWEYTLDGSIVMEGCVSTRYSMPLYMEVYDRETGNTDFRIALKDFQN